MLVRPVSSHPPCSTSILSQIYQAFNVLLCSALISARLLITFHCPPSLALSARFPPMCEPYALSDHSQPSLHSSQFQFTAQVRVHLPAWARSGRAYHTHTLTRSEQELQAQDLDPDLGGGARSKGSRSRKQARKARESRSPSPKPSRIRGGTRKGKEEGTSHIQRRARNRN